MLYAGEGRTELGIGKVIDAGFLTSAFPFLVLEQKLGVNVEYRLIVYRLQCLACVVLFLVMLLSRRKSKAEGILALRFWSIFASMQIFWESLRDDGHMLFIFLRIGQVAAGIVLLWVLIDLSRCYRQAGLHMPWFVWPVFVLLYTTRNKQTKITGSIRFPLPVSDAARHFYSKQFSFLIFYCGCAA